MEQEDFCYLAHSGTDELPCPHLTVNAWTEWECFIRVGTTCFPKLTNSPLLCLKSFSSVTSLGHRARSNQSHAASFGAVLFLHSQPRPSSPVWNSPCINLTGVELVRPPFVSFFSTSLLTMSHSTRLKAASRPSSIGWSFEDIKIGQLGERWSERRLVLLGSPLRDGQMDGWHVQTVASVSPLSWTQSCQKLCQTHVRQMGSLCSLGFCSVKPPPPTPPSAPSPFIAPS